MAMLAAASSASLAHHLTSSDAGWFAKVVNQGYYWPGVEGRSDLAFFPLYPALAKGVTALGASTTAALLSVAWLSTVAAAVLLVRLGAAVRTPAVGLWLALLWLIAPRSHVQVMGYSEPLFTALAAACLLMLVQRRWLWAGVLCGLAGLTRSTGLALIATLGLAAIWAVVQAEPTARLRTALRAGLACIIGASGFVGFWSYTAWRVGDVRGYLLVQEEWGSVSAPPWMLPVNAIQHLGSPWPFSSVAVVVLASFVLVVWLLGSREDWRLVAYACLGFLMISFQGGYFRSKARLVMPFFPIWLPPARKLVRLPAWAQVLLFLCLAIGSAIWGVDVSMGKVSP